MDHPKKALLFKALEEIYGEEAVPRMLNIIRDLFEPEPGSSDELTLDVHGRSSKALNTPALRIVREHYKVNPHPKGAELAALVKQVASVTQDQTEAQLQFPVSNYFRQKRWHQVSKERKQEAMRKRSQESGSDVAAPAPLPSRHRVHNTDIVRPASVVRKQATEATVLASQWYTEMKLGNC